MVYLHLFAKLSVRIENKSPLWIFDRFVIYLRAQPQPTGEKENVEKKTRRRFAEYS